MENKGCSDRYCGACPSLPSDRSEPEVREAYFDGLVLALAEARVCTRMAQHPQSLRPTASGSREWLRDACLMSANDALYWSYLYASF